MTTYWISNPKHWCDVCRTWCDAKQIQIKKHESGAKHKKNIEMMLRRKKREKWLHEKKNLIEINELHKIESVKIS